MQRKFLVKLRLGVLTLQIETGRFQRPRLPAEVRLCVICNNGEVEDEAHFLLRCAAYRRQRLILLDKLADTKAFLLLSDKEKLSVLLNGEFVKSTAQFIIDSFDHRSLLL